MSCGPCAACPHVSDKREITSALIGRLIRCVANRFHRLLGGTHPRLSSVRHECREARPRAYRSAAPTRSLIVNRRAIEARWRSVVHIPPSFRFGIVGRSSRQPRGLPGPPAPVEELQAACPLSTPPVELCQQGANRRSMRLGGTLRSELFPRVTSRLHAIHYCPPNSLASQLLGPWGSSRSFISCNFRCNSSPLGFPAPPLIPRIMVSRSILA
jgi:hypothetical protein